MATKRPQSMRALEAGIINGPLQQHGTPNLDHWRRVMVCSPNATKAVQHAVIMHLSALTAAVAPARHAKAGPLAPSHGATSMPVIVIPSLCAKGSS